MQCACCLYDGLDNRQAVTSATSYAISFIVFSYPRSTAHRASMLHGLRHDPRPERACGLQHPCPRHEPNRLYGRDQSHSAARIRGSSRWWILAENAPGLAGLAGANPVNPDTLGLREIFCITLVGERTEIRQNDRFPALELRQVGRHECQRVVRQSLLLTGVLFGLECVLRVVDRERGRLGD